LNQPDQEDDERIHELVDIIAEEVSDVDRAANRRTYLVVKRDAEGDEEAPDAEISAEDEDVIVLDKAEDDDEDVIVLDKAEDDDEAEDDEQKDDEAEAPRKPAKGRARKQALVLPPGTRKPLLDRTARALERLTALVQAVKDAEERQGVFVPASVPRDIRAICDELASLLGRSSQTSKAGAKMASTRRRQLENAIEVLQKILDEVMPQLAGHTPQAQPSATPVAKQQPDASSKLAQVLGSMSESMAALGARIRAQDAEIARLKKSTGLPASRPVETVRAPKSPEVEGWPLDMNAPLSRDSVAKEISFFDE
jgi:hypothetical protein